MVQSSTTKLVEDEQLTNNATYPGTKIRDQQSNATFDQLWVCALRTWVSLGVQSLCAPLLA
jgi:hypothetical protein